MVLEDCMGGGSTSAIGPCVCGGVVRGSMVAAVVVVGGNG